MRSSGAIVVLSTVAIAAHLVFRFSVGAGTTAADAPLWAALLFGGIPLVYELVRQALRREFGSDLLAGISIVTAGILGEYLAGTIVVLMLAGGKALEFYALRSASSVLGALARRMPSIAHRQVGESLADLAIADIAVGDRLVIYPHETCPTDGLVTAGHGSMDESYLTGEPFHMTKTSGSAVISGAINGDSALTIQVTKRAEDSRYAKIMAVMRESAVSRPRLRRLGDQLGAVYTPVALAVALVAWAMFGDAVRFLAVLVIATPCPLLIAIPIAIVGSISLCARRAIVVRRSAALELIAECRTAIFDKTGTLTYGEPALTEEVAAPGYSVADVLALVASLERYSRHPLARAVLQAAEARGLALMEATEVCERPGQGLGGIVMGRSLLITSRSGLAKAGSTGVDQLPEAGSGLEAIVAIDGRYAAVLRFRDAPRADSRSFISHLGPVHQLGRVMILSGDREAEARYLADQVGVDDVRGQQTPEDKLAIVRQETGRAKTVYIGDGINDAPAMLAATVSLAMGSQSDVTAEAADVVIMDGSLRKVDEFIHIGRRMRVIALESALGGMGLSLLGMVAAATGHLGPVSGAICQECIDVLAIANALRAAWPPRMLHDI